MDVYTGNFFLATCCNCAILWSNSSENDIAGISCLFVGIEGINIWNKKLPERDLPISGPMYANLKSSMGQEKKWSNEGNRC